MSEAKRASLVFPVNSNVIFIREIGLVVIARPMEAIDDIIAHETVIVDDGGVVGMIDFEGYTRSATVVFDHRDAIVNGRLVVGVGDGGEEVIEIVFGRDASPYVCERGAIDGGGEVGELVDDLTVGIERIDVVPDAAHAVIEMDIHDALGRGLHGLDEQFAGRLDSIGIDHESKDPIVGIGRQIREEMRDRSVLETMAGERRNIELPFLKQAVSPQDIFGVGGVEHEHHELLGMVERIHLIVRRNARDEVIRVFVRTEVILDESRRDDLRTHLYRHILCGPRCIRVAGREHYYD